MKKIPYSQQLNDPRWQKKRLEVFERDNWTCKKCPNGLNTGTQLHVHHKEYHRNTNVWDYDDSLLETLCRKCHEKEHAKPIEYPHSTPLAESEWKDFIKTTYDWESNQGFEMAAKVHLHMLDNALREARDKPYEFQEEILKNIMFIRDQIKKYKEDNG